MNGFFKSLAIAAIVAIGSSSAKAISPILTNSGFNANTLAANDDGSTGAIPLGFTVNYFGLNSDAETQVYVNNNGNITFDHALSAYTPSGLTTDTSNAIIAPYWGDVDTRGTGSGLVQYGTDTVGGHAAFGVNWPSVGYYDGETDKLNTFQLVLIDRSDVGTGDFDIEFNYAQIQWETGDLSGGSDGLGGSSAHVGYTNGTGVTGSYYELPGSGVNGAFLDGGPDALISNSNDGTPGQYLFEVRGGQVIQPPPTGSTVPVPPAVWSGLAMLALLGSVKGYGAARRRLA